MCVDLILTPLGLECQHRSHIFNILYHWKLLLALRIKLWK